MTIKIYNWDSLSSAEQFKVLSRPAKAIDFNDKVESIVNAVKTGGDKVLFAYSREFDGVTLESLSVSEKELLEAKIPAKEQAAIEKALETITLFHQAAKPKNFSVVTAEGIRIEKIYKPINRVGLYVPGGNNTPLISTLLMLALPSEIAQCPLRVVCTPANAQGQIDPRLLVTARLCKIKSMYKVGGAQAIAAMAYGTESLPKVDKIFGPGNQYVTQAKTLVASDPGGAAIDMPAGPSEVMILADDYADPEFIAADLLAQAEHGSDSQVLVLCSDTNLATKIQDKVKVQMQNLKRQSILETSLKHSAILYCPDKSQQLQLVRDYAPEHLIINRKDRNDWIQEIDNAGTVFMGPWAAETLGDYLTGSNHVLPTSGFAKSHSGLSTFDFMRSYSVQSVSAEGMKEVGAYAAMLATMEGLDAHANAVLLRLKALEN